MQIRAISGTDEHFDLLPYVAILLCVMGCLLLVTLAYSAISLGTDSPEGWIISNDGQRSMPKPVLIEWDGKLATVHRGKSKETFQWLDDRSVNADGSPVGRTELTTEMKSLLDEFERQKASHYALFAVRPSGFDSYAAFSNSFRRRGIRVGAEPVAQQRAIHLLTKEK